MGPLGGGEFHEGGALMNGMSALNKQTLLLSALFNECPYKQNNLLTLRRF